jgi:hypothetical protein
MRQLPVLNPKAITDFELKSEKMARLSRHSPARPSKPARGNFLPILDCGFGLQYSPIMEYREGKGMVLFCQLDVTGRTETDPAAETLVRNIMHYVSQWRPISRRRVVYVGDSSGRAFLESIGVNAQPYDGKLSRDEVLVAGPACGEVVGKDQTILTNFLKSGGNLLAIGLSQDDVNMLLPFKVTMRKAEYISSLFESAGQDSLLAGIGPADVHNRDPRELPLVSSGAEVLGDGILASVTTANIVFVQMAPWQFESSQTPNLKRTFRHVAVLLNRLLGNMGVAGLTPLLDRFGEPVPASELSKPLASSLYLDQPTEWDDPYRFFRW